MYQTHPIFLLYEKYPQLTMPIEKGIRQTEEYRDVCLRGGTPARRPDFILNRKDTLEMMHTPAGDVPVLTLYERQDFEHAYMALGNRCEPMDIAPSIGAVTFLGLNNWEKIRNLTISPADADKSMYQDVFILLSGGPYSDVSGELFGIEEDKWLEKSVTIRKYHELTHFISRTLYPQNKSPIRDEIMADMIGILYAFGHYDPQMAKTFLGIENRAYREGGRLQNYVRDGLNLEDVIKEAGDYIEKFSAWLDERSMQEPFDALLLLEEEKQRNLNS